MFCSKSVAGGRCELLEILPNLLPNNNFAGQSGSAVVSLASAHIFHVICLQAGCPVYFDG